MTDPWLVDVESYVLGALDGPERTAFEEHLRGCPTCRAAVDEVGPLPALLDLVPPDLMAEIAAADPVAVAVPRPPADRVPDSVLAGLLWSVRRQEHLRRRRRVVVGAFAVAAAVLLAVLLPASPLSLFGRPASDVRVVTMSATASSPITASVALEDVAWGTKIDLSCTYAAGAGRYAPQSTYSLVVVAADGTTEQVATWAAVPGVTITVPAASDRPITQIASIELLASDGSTLLTAGM